MDVLSPVPDEVPGSAVFRDCLGEFATGVTVVTAEHDGEPAGMTLNAFTSVSLDPLLVLVSLGHGSRTLTAVRQSKRFAVSILHRGQSEAAVDFAARGMPFPAHHVRRTFENFSAVEGAAAVLCCGVTEIVVAGDHDLVIGEVLAIEHRGGEPLVFYRGSLGGMQADSAIPAGHPISLDEGAGW